MVPAKAFHVAQIQEAQLWNIADILRGKVDADEFNDFENSFPINFRFVIALEI